jgi:NADH-quinone oxidoreductase subunit N
MGYALVGLAAGTQAGINGVILYMTIYMVMTLGTFALIIGMRKKEGMVEELDDLKGLASRHPMLAVLMTLLMFSLAGIPPLAGFFAKYFVFVAAIEADLFALAIIGVLSSVVGAYYYIRIIKMIWFDEAANAEKYVPMATELKLVLGVSVLFISLFYLFAGPVFDQTSAAAASFF